VTGADRAVTRLALEPGPLAGQALILPAGEIIAPRDLIRAITAELPGAEDAKAARAIAVRHLAEARARGNAALAAAFAARPREARPLVTAQAHLTDGLVTTALAVAQALHPLANPTEAERIAVLAVGGYGRAEMAPQSDVDLLFLTPWKITPWAEIGDRDDALPALGPEAEGRPRQRARSRTASARPAPTSPIRTALLEHRFIAGYEPLATELADRLWSELFRNTGPEFIEAKLAERAERHKRQGGQRYVLEPNVKEGKGGLRDLQTLYWIGKYLHRVPTRRGLVGPAC
jgi:[protein-PII] uridylyltransferase